MICRALLTDIWPRSGLEADEKDSFTQSFVGYFCHWLAPSNFSNLESKTPLEFAARQVALIFAGDLRTRGEEEDEDLAGELSRKLDRVSRSKEELTIEMLVRNFAQFVVFPKAREEIANVFRIYRGEKTAQLTGI